MGEKMAMKRCWLLAATTGLFFVAGCAGPLGASVYTRIDLDRDLGAAALARYRAEASDVAGAGQKGHMQVLERSNWWPLGLLAFWHQGTVRAMQTHEGATHYMVSQSRGYGPLSMFFVLRKEAVFRDDGRRLNGARASSVLWGHAAMFHTMESRREDGSWQRHGSAHLVHHLVNWARAHGRLSVSLLSAPNPIEFGG